MKAKSIKGITAGDIRTALAEALADGFKPTVAAVFMSVKQDRTAVCRLLDEHGIDVFGATSAGEFIDGYQDEGSVVILLLDINPTAYTIIYEELGDGAVSDMADRLAQKALQAFRKPAFLLCSTGLSESGVFMDGETLVRRIEAVVGPQVDIYGGMAGDDITMTGTYVFTHGHETDEGVVALVLDEDKISLSGMAMSGWKPLGISRKVTRSTGNWIYTIDDQPALDMYLKYLGREPRTEDDKHKMFEEIGVHFPFQVEREKGDPVMRTPMAINMEENALMCDFDVPQGSNLRFSMPPDFDVVEKVLAEARTLKATHGLGAEALLIFSCAGRLSALGPMTRLENEGLGELWQAPMAGFFTYGEYGRATNGRPELLSTTCCWVALHEKAESNNPNNP